MFTYLAFVVCRLGRIFLDSLQKIGRFAPAIHPLERAVWPGPAEQTEKLKDIYPLNYAERKGEKKSDFARILKKSYTPNFHF